VKREIKAANEPVWFEKNSRETNQRRLKKTKRTQTSNSFQVDDFLEESL